VTIKEAIASILEEAGEPLGYREIARRAIEQGHWSTGGKTPEATVNAQITTDIKRKGEKSLFRRVSPGVYELRDATAPGKSALGVDSGEPATSSMTFLDAAERVLEESGEKTPMHYREITRRAVKNGWLISGGQTPEATMAAQLATEIKRSQSKGITPRFIRHERGFYGLSRWMGKGLFYQIERHNQRIRQQLLGRIRELSPGEFEALIGQLLTALNFEKVEVTRQGGDGGIDVRGILVVGEILPIQMAVQVKRWKANVQAPTVQQVRGSLGAHEQGLIITTSGFSSGAKEAASRSDAAPVGLMNGDQLVQLLVANNIGVRRTNPDIIELGDFKEDAGENGDEPV
jgi:restriction system protein